MQSTIVIPALFAGLVAIGVTAAIEWFGARWGGLISTLPSTIVPASWGIYLSAHHPEAFVDAMGFVPVGMAINAFFLYLWRVLPPRLPQLPLVASLALCSFISLTSWAVLAAVAVAWLHDVEHILYVGTSFLLGTAVVGLSATTTHVNTVAAKSKISYQTHLIRGLLAALAVGLAASVAAAGEGLLAGMASVFPAIFLTAMVSLWWSQGRAVPSAAIGPMMLGSTSVGAFALFAAVLFPVVGLPLGTLISWGLAISLTTLPAAIWLRPQNAWPQRR